MNVAQAAKKDKCCPSCDTIFSSQCCPVDPRQMMCAGCSSSFLLLCLTVVVVFIISSVGFQHKDTHMLKHTPEDIVESQQLHTCWDRDEVWVTCGSEVHTLTHTFPSIYLWWEIHRYFCCLIARSFTYCLNSLAVLCWTDPAWPSLLLVCVF